MRLIRPSARAAAVAALAVMTATAMAQTPQTPHAPQTTKPLRSLQTPRRSPRPGGGPGAGASAQGAQPTPNAAPRPVRIKPYAEVITSEARSDPGLFTVHQLNEKVYFEIPEDQLGKEMLWATEIAQLPAGFGYGGTAVGNRVVRWTRRGNRIYLRNVDFTLRAQDKGAIQRAIEAASLEPIIMAFDVEAEGKNKSAVIDVTRLISSDVPEFSARQALNGGSLDSSRSYVDRVKAFPTNIEMRSMLTYTLAPPQPQTTPPPPGPGPRSRPQRPRNVNSVTALINYSMVELPQTPMRGRYFDSRVGFFSQGFEDYSSDENRVRERRFIARYRLEKKDPNAAVSEPVKPIVYYISREVPEKWRPYIKRGVEDWQVAFEQAGFKNAILCKEAPSVEEDPNWDPEDARYSVIRWAPTQTENAMGPHVHDPRSGEIISAHIIVWHNVLKLAEDWYFVQASPNDPRAHRLPLPEALQGELIRYVLAHEVGHTLGLQHNFKASSSYTISQLRSKDYTEKFGDEASIMDYGRFNYVAQPGDNARLIPMIGPYDRFAIEWGYRPILSARNSEKEKPELDRMSSRQMADPRLRFGNNRLGEDPTQQTEDLGSDAVEATRLGLLNIKRVAKLLIPATVQFGEDYDLLRDTYSQLVGQRRRELNHVVSLVGGTVETDYHAGRGGAVYRPVSAARQAQAVRFLVDEGFTTPTYLLTPDIIGRIQSAGQVDDVVSGQRALLASLLSDARVKRLQDIEVMYPAPHYTVRQLVEDIQGGLFSELSLPRPVADVYRRQLQRAYLEIMKGKLVGDQATQTDLRPLALASLRRLARQIDAALPKTTDYLTAAHLEDARKQIERIVNPRQ